jgi:hypothetical protein
MVEPRQPSSLRAGMITDNRVRGLADDGGVGLAILGFGGKF